MRPAPAFTGPASANARRQRTSQATSRAAVTVATEARLGHRAHPAPPDMPMHAGQEIASRRACLLQAHFTYKAAQGTSALIAQRARSHGLTSTCHEVHRGVCRWVYRNPFSILDPNAVDRGMGSRNGTVDSVLSRVSRTYQPRLRYDHMGTLSHLPNGSIAAQWQVCHSTQLKGCRDCSNPCPYLVAWKFIQSSGIQAFVASFGNSRNPTAVSMVWPCLRGVQLVGMPPAMSMRLHYCLQAPCTL